MFRAKETYPTCQMKVEEDVLTGSNNLLHMEAGRLNLLKSFLNIILRLYLEEFLQEEPGEDVLLV